MKRACAGLTFACALLLALAVASPATADEAVRIRQVDVHAYPLVSLTVTLAGGGSLTPADVRLFENGRVVPPMSVIPVGPTSGQVDVVLVIDTSNSMRGAALTQAYQAARAFTNGLPPWIRVGLVTFARTPTVVSPVSADHSAVSQALASVPTTTNQTALYAAVQSAAGMFSGAGQHNIILLTDGHDTVGGSLAGAVQAAKSARASVYTIGMGDASTDVATLQGLASGTGGTFFPASTVDLAQIYQALGKELSQQYVVRYRSRARAGSQVAITVRVPAGSDSAVAVLPLPHLLPQPTRGRWPAFLAGTIGLVTVLGLFFLALFLLLTTTLAGASRRRRDSALGRRVGVVAADAPPRPDQAPRATAWIPGPLAAAGDRLASASGMNSSLEVRLERAGVLMRPGEFVVGVVACAALGLIVGAALRNWLLLVVLGVAGGAAPFLWLRFKVNGRMGRLHEQLPDLLMILASSLRAGHSFMQALDMVTQEIGEPAAGEFARLLTEIRLGRPVPDALNAMAERVGSEDFKWAVMAVNIQREVGGNLAEILENVAETVRDRSQIRRQVRVLSSEGRLSVTVLIALPFFLGAALEIINPGYINTLFTDFIGWVLLGLAGVLMIVGILWMRKLVRIDV